MSGESELRQHLDTLLLKADFKASKFLQEPSLLNILFAFVRVAQEDALYIVGLHRDKLSPSDQLTLDYAARDLVSDFEYDPSFKDDHRGIEELEVEYSELQDAFYIKT